MSSKTDINSNWCVDILMYHSISDAGGPTSIPEPVFRAQMEAIAGAGGEVISLDTLVERMIGDIAPKSPTIVLTFDDGFCDFATAAWPVIQGHGWPVTVFLPTGHVGDKEGWQGTGDPPRMLMDWDQISQLSAEGVGFEAHSVSHPDLTALGEAALDAEIMQCKAIIAERTGREPRHFAPPYGLANEKTRRAISQHFSSSSGTRLDRAGRQSDLFDLPRLEMFYFTNPTRWRDHVLGRGSTYLTSRKVLRAVGSGISKPWRRM